MKYRTLVIDDSSIQRLATTFLVKTHPDLEFVADYSNPHEGFKAIQKQDIDIVLLDVLMEDVTAFELLDIYKINTAIIINSTWPRFAVQAFDYGVNDFLIKPIPKVKFHKSIEKVIQQIESKKIFNKKIEIFFFSENLSDFK